jgi:hypothetical protein
MLTRTSQKIKTLVDSGRVTVDAATGTIVGARGRGLKVRADRNGYLTVSLAGDHLFVHRIVAYCTFGEEALEVGRIITHRDGDRTHNAAGNLRIASPFEARARSARRRSLQYPVLDPGTGEETARFASAELAEEYALWKYPQGSAKEKVKRV